MSKIKQAAWIAMGLLVVLSLLAGVEVCAKPCKCAFGSPGTPANGLKDMDVIFVGKAAAVEEAKDAQDFFDVTFEVNKYYKGEGEPSIYVRTDKDRNRCGFKFDRNKEYLVYAKYHNGVLLTDACSRTRTIEKARVEGDISTLDMIVFAGTTTAEAEEATQLDPRLKDLLDADAVFLGEVLDIKPSKDVSGMLDVKFQVKTSFSVGKTNDPELIVRTPQDVRHQGFDFTSSQYKQYLVYAYNRR